MNIVNAQVQEIQKRCGNDKERYNQELQKFYAENGVNPMGGCGWSLLPIVFLYPLYAIIRRPLKYMMWLSEEAVTAVAHALGWADFTPVGYNELTLGAMMNAGNLETAKAAVGASATSLFVVNFNFFGIDLSQIPQLKFWENGVTWGSVGLFLLPLCIYWIANSLLGMVQEVICGRMLRKDYEAAQREIEEQQRKAKEAEKERRRKAAEKKAAAIAAGKSGKKQPQAKHKGVDLSASREGLRTYARGRAYDPNRYPVTPYRDPNGPAKPVEEEPKKLTEEEKAILAESNPELMAQAAAAELAAAEQAAAVQEDETAAQPAQDAEEGYEAAYADEETENTEE